MNAPLSKPVAFVTKRLRWGFVAKFGFVGLCIYVAGWFAAGVIIAVRGI